MTVRGLTTSGLLTTVTATISTAWRRRRYIRFSKKGMQVN